MASAAPGLPPAGPAARALTLVIKVGTTSICDEATHSPRLSGIARIIETIVQLVGRGHKVVFVSSGAVGTGLKRVDMDKKPKQLAKKQALAAIGQGRLMSLYDYLFEQFDQVIAQVLITRNDIVQRSQYLNAINTFQALLDMGVVPIVNENDTISVSELKFGDNDTLSAITANMVNADFLFLLTDVDALYTDNPRTNPAARPVYTVHDVDRLKETIETSSAGSNLGTGGMVTKLIAADLATSAGCETVILNGQFPERIFAILEHLAAADALPPPSPTEPAGGAARPAGVPLFTHFVSRPRVPDRKFWLQHGLKPRGTLFLDGGAVRAAALHRSSLFAAGIVGVEGDFERDQSVRLVTVVRAGDAGRGSGGPGSPAGAGAGAGTRRGFGDAPTASAFVGPGEREVDCGRGLVGYSSDEIRAVCGLSSEAMRQVIGWADSEWVIHRDNLVMLDVPWDWAAGAAPTQGPHERNTGPALDSPSTAAAPPPQPLWTRIKWPGRRPPG